MNDQELISAVRQSVGGVSMSVPEERITSRGRVIRAGRRRRAAAAASAVAVAGAAAVAAAVVLPGSAAPATRPPADAAFAATPHAGGTVTLAVYDESGYAGINARLRELGDSRVVVVPAKAGCPTSLSSLPAPKVQGHGWTVVSADGKTGAVTVKAEGIPKGDILVVAIDRLSVEGRGGLVGWSIRLTSPPAPACASLPLPAGSDSVRYSGEAG